MRDATDWLLQSKRSEEIDAIHEVLKFQQRAAAAAYRTTIDVENVEELFSLASAIGDDALKKSFTLAIAATLDACRNASGVNTLTAGIPPNIAQRLPWKRATNQTGIDPTQLVRFEQPVHDYYVACMLGLLDANPPAARNTFITFNYDLVLEDALAGLGFRISYGIPRARLTPAHTIYEAGEPSVPVLKLHGSMNWVRPGRRGERLTAYAAYSEVRARGKLPVLIPPTWKKDFSRTFADVWDQAIAALQQATRVITIGFSMPETDVHFKYLLSAGLQENVSLRKILFADPTIRPVAIRALRVLRRELQARGILSFEEETARTLLLNRGNIGSIGRAMHAQIVWNI